MPFYFAAGEIVPADKLGSYDSFTPTLTAETTNPNLGADGFALGDYFVNGFLVTVTVRILFSGTGVSAGTGGFYEIQMPFPGHASLGSIIGSTTIGSGTAVGSGIIRKNASPAAGDVRHVQIYFASASGGRVRMLIDSTVASVGPTTGSSIFAFAASGRITFNATYPADPATLP